MNFFKKKKKPEDDLTDQEDFSEDEKERSLVEDDMRQELERLLEGELQKIDPDESIQSLEVLDEDPPEEVVKDVLITELHKLITKLPQDSALDLEENVTDEVEEVDKVEELIQDKVEEEKQDEILAELEEAERQARTTAEVINKLKQCINNLCQKDKMFKEDIKCLEEKTQELRKQMQIFEEKTKRIQFLIKKSNLFDLKKRSLEQEVLHETPVSEDGDKKKIKTTCTCHGIAMKKEDLIIENLRKQLNNMQGQMRICSSENAVLNEKLLNLNRSKLDSPIKSCGKGREEVQNRLKEYADITQLLEKQLCKMQCEIRNIQNELGGVQRERAKKCSCCVHPASAPFTKKGPNEQKLKELQEQQKRFQEDLKGKQIECTCLHAELEHYKIATDSFGQIQQNSEDKIKDLEDQLKSLKANQQQGLSKEQYVEQKQRFLEAQDELGGLRLLNQDQQAQLEEYKNKYLGAQQVVEEQARQIELMDMENSKMSEQVNLELQRVKQQFQEKLQQLQTLPDVLKATQFKLQDAQKLRLQTEQQNEFLLKELDIEKDNLKALRKELDLLKNKDDVVDDNPNKIQELQRNLEEAQKEIEQLKSDNLKLQEELDEQTHLAESRLDDTTQLTSQLEKLQEDTARQIAQTKSCCETIRRSLQDEIDVLEQKLSQARAKSKFFLQNCDEMLPQLKNLSGTFQDAQATIRSLQEHVNFLKSSCVEPRISLPVVAEPSCQCPE